jgi:hypothetical protein
LGLSGGGLEKRREEFLFNLKTGRIQIDDHQGELLSPTLV